MNDGQSRHPEAHTMAAFVDGTLAPSELTTVATHLRDCADCRVVVTETARFEREEEALATSRPFTCWTTSPRRRPASAAMLHSIGDTEPQNTFALFAVNSGPGLTAKALSARRDRN